jgi:hypothetical protein
MATGGWQDKFRSTIELTLQLALIGLNSGYAVRVMPFGDSVASERVINVLHARQLLGSMRERLAGLEPSGATNFDALGAASLDWRNQGALVVVLTDLLFDVDDDRMNDTAPQDLPQLPLTSTERGLLNSVRAQARRRLMLSAQNVARGLKFLSHPNIRGVLCQVSGAQDQDLSQARQIVDMESGVLQRLAFTRAASKAYTRTALRCLGLHAVSTSATHPLTPVLPGITTAATCTVFSRRWPVRAMPVNLQKSRRSDP